ncbi:MAG: TRAP transporter substrate-binding protein [Burkholderiaceae bacterium]|nr:TRAP transporter substrate-binding protein [Burkholderiaceae bacterium]
MKKFALLAVVAAVTLIGTPVASQAEKLRLGHVSPVGGLYDQVAKSFAEKLAKSSEGKDSIEILPNGVLGAQPQLLSQLSAGTLDFWVVDTPAITIAPAGRDYQVLLAPFLFDTQAQFRRFMQSPVAEEMAEKVRLAVGIRHLSVGADQAPRALSTRKTAVMKPADLSRLKVRVPETPFLVEAWKAWGASPTPVKATELFSSLQSGLVDGQENGLGVFLDFSLNEVQEYFIELDYVRSGVSIFMSEKTWQKLSPESRERIAQAARAVSTESAAKYDSYMESLRQRAKEKGTKVVVPDVAAFRAASVKIVEDFDGKAWPKGMLERIRAAAR